MESVVLRAAAAYGWKLRTRLEIDVKIFFHFFYESCLDVNKALNTWFAVNIYLNIVTVQN